MRQVIEADFRKPEYRDAKIEEYEFRSDGKLVRKDRFLVGMSDVAYYVLGGIDWEVTDVVAAVRKMYGSGEKGKDRGIERVFQAAAAKQEATK